MCNKISSSIANVSLNVMQHFSQNDYATSTQDSAFDFKIQTWGRYPEQFSRLSVHLSYF